MNLSEIANNKQLNNEERCIRYLEKMRWPEGVACPQCGNKSISSFEASNRSGKIRHLYQCLDKTCRYQFSATTGTIFHDSHLPLSKWFAAISMVGDSKPPISANQLRLALEVQYKTAAHVLGRIREAMANGTIEMKGASPAAMTPAEASEAGPTRSARSRAPRTSHAGPSRQPTSDAALNVRREETADFLKQIKPADDSVSPTAIDNMLSMFVSLAQMSVKPPLFFVSYLKDKVFT